MDFPLSTPAAAMDMLRPPPDDALRRVVHDEVHARPMPLITLPARVLYVAVLHGADSSREQELAHLQTLPGQSGLPVELRRRFVVESRRGPEPFVGFGGWDLDVPYLYGVFDGGYKWNAGSLGGSSRCTQMWYPQTIGGFEISDVYGSAGYQVMEALMRS